MLTRRLLHKAGLDAQLAEKRAASYNVELEQEAQQWIEAVTGETFPGSFQESLKDGVILCKYALIMDLLIQKSPHSSFRSAYLTKNYSLTPINSSKLSLRLINKICPGAIKKIGSAKAPFVMMVRHRPFTFLFHEFVLNLQYICFHEI